MIETAFGLSVWVLKFALSVVVLGGGAFLVFASVRAFAQAFQESDRREIERAKAAHLKKTQAHGRSN